MALDPVIQDLSRIPQLAGHNSIYVMQQQGSGMYLLTLMVVNCTLDMFQGMIQLADERMLGPMTGVFHPRSRNGHGTVKYLLRVS